MNLNKTSKELDRIFSEVNGEFFNNELETPMIIIQSTGKRPVYGYCTNNKVWTDGNEQEERANYEIGISAEHLKRDVYGIVGTMIHEMVHLLQVKEGVKGTSNNGAYHNKKFKNEAENRGLVIEKAPTIGWSVTSLQEDTKKFVDSLAIDEEAFAYFRKRVEKKSASAPKKYRYVCPSCDESIWAKNPNLMAICECGSMFEAK